MMLTQYSGLGLLLLIIVQTSAITTLKISSSTAVLKNCTMQNIRNLPNFSKLIHIKAIGCEIVTFDGLGYQNNMLNVLEITDSRLTNIVKDSLNDLKHLKNLSLPKNDITIVESWSYEPLNALTTLNLKSNLIVTLRPGCFQSYPYLQYLNLAGNKLENLNDAVFHHIRYLNYLNLSRNRFKTITKNFFNGLHYLTHLDLCRNQIKHIDPDVFATHNHLRSLHLEENDLMDLNFVSSSSFNRLEYLNLSHNSIENLEPFVFSKTIDLINLDLSYNDLDNIPANIFTGLESLQFFNLSNNKIIDIAPSGLRYLENIRHISLENNHIKHLPNNVFNETKLLEIISFSHNQLEEVNDGIFSTLFFLKNIDLSQNYLSSANFTENLPFLYNPNELTLNLADNHLQFINTTILKDLKRIDLANNNWRCDWIVGEILKGNENMNFGKLFVEKSLDKTVKAKGIDCDDGHSKKTIIFVDSTIFSSVELISHEKQQVATSPPEFIWPKIPTEKFDSRSVIIWMLIAIGIMFSILRVARQLFDQKERKTLLEREKQLNALRSARKEENRNLITGNSIRNADSV